MRILIVDFAASEGGAMTILRQYYESAVKDKKNNYIFLISSNYFKETENVKIIVLKKEKQWLRRLIFDHFTGRRLVKKIKPDKILSLQNTIIRGAKVSQILYVHQSIPFQRIKKFSLFKKGERKLAVIQRFVGREIIASIKKADGVIVQTNWMKDAVIRRCRVSANKISVETPKVRVGVVKSVKKMKKNMHFFYPTSDVIYKNNQVIYDAVEILKKEGFNDFVVEMTIDGESTKQIKKIGRISHEEVMKKYKDSALLFPSYIETFGLPLLEARECNAEIIAADTEFAREVLDGYKNVCYFAYDSADELADKMKNILIKQRKE